MSSLSKTREDYVRLGRSRDLELVGIVPTSVKEPTHWRCIHCGTVHYKTFRALKMRENGCTCQNDLSMKPDDYKELADRLGIEWVGKLQPKNTKTLTQWRNPHTGVVVEATYSQLAYGFIRADLRRALGIEEEEELAFG